MIGGEVIFSTQARDFIATLRARDSGAFMRVKHYLAEAYFILNHWKTSRYPEAILLWFLQVEYMETINHPALGALKQDIALGVELRGR